MKDLYIFGAGGGAIETLEDVRWIEGKNLFSPKKIILVEDKPKESIKELLDKRYPVIPLTDIPGEGEIYGHISAFTPKYKEKLDKMAGLKWVIALSHLAQLPHLDFVGINVRAYVFIGKTATLGRHVKINYHSVITHNCEIGDYTFISHNVGVSAKTKIGKRCSIYEGTTILPGVTIGDDTVIGANSLVTKDIPSGVKAYGSPARVVKEND